MVGSSAEPPKLRAALRGLTRYIGTTLSARHRVFGSSDAGVLPAPDRRRHRLGRPLDAGGPLLAPHRVWAEATGGRLGVGNDLRYLKAACFDAFPFPAANAKSRARIARLGARIEAHRQSRQAAHPDLTVTAMYNVMAKLRSGDPLTARETSIRDRGRVGRLSQLSSDLDAAVIEAYGWPAGVEDEAILERLVALNAERAAEERRGIVRWVRPERPSPPGPPLPRSLSTGLISTGRLPRRELLPPGPLPRQARKGERERGRMRRGSRSPRLARRLRTGSIARTM